MTLVCELVSKVFVQQNYLPVFVNYIMQIKHAAVWDIRNHLLESQVCCTPGFLFCNFYLFMYKLSQAAQPVA